MADYSAEERALIQQTVTDLSRGCNEETVVGGYTVQCVMEREHTGHCGGYIPDADLTAWTWWGANEPSWYDEWRG